MSVGGAIVGSGGGGSSSNHVCVIVEHRGVGRVVDVRMRGVALPWWDRPCWAGSGEEDCLVSTALLEGGG